MPIEPARDGELGARAQIAVIDFAIIAVPDQHGRQGRPRYLILDNIGPDAIMRA
jgi:hypothetical protein